MQQTQPSNRRALLVFVIINFSIEVRHPTLPRKFRYNYRISAADLALVAIQETCFVHVIMLSRILADPEVATPKVQPISPSTGGAPYL
jgi:hypothetical protein